MITLRRCRLVSGAAVLAVMLGVFVQAQVFAANCSSPPMPPGGRVSGSWWSSYSSWCRSCGGTPYQNSSGGGCRPGPNWGGNSSSGSSASPSMPFTMPSTGNANNDLALGMAQIGTQMLVQGLLSMSQEDPQQKARREAEARRTAEEAQRRAAEQAQRQEEQHRDLLASLIPGPGSASTATSGLPQGNNTTGAKSNHFTKGFEDASQCYPDNAFGYCIGVRKEDQDTCPNDYRAGFEVGDKRRQLVMDEAYRAGEQAGRAGDRNGSFTDHRAQGPCRLQWIETYNRGHFSGKNAKAAP